MKQAKGPLVPDPALAPYIRLAFEEYAKGGHTYESLAHLLAERGMRSRNGKPPFKQLVHHILTNPIYCGVMEVWGERHAGTFEPLVSIALFEECQPRRRANADARPARSRYNPDFPLRRAVCTECGGRLTGSFGRSRNGNRYPYYHHQNRNCERAAFLPKETLESSFVEHLAAIATKPAFESMFARAVTEKWHEWMQGAARERTRIERDMESLLAQRQRVYEFHRAGQYTDDEFREQRAAVTAQLEACQLSLEGLESDDFALEPALRECLEVTRQTADLWQRATPAWRLRFQTVIFVDGEMRLSGMDFSNSILTSIYQLHREFAADPSSLVPRVGLLWNQLLEDVKRCAQFYRELKEAQNGETPNAT